MRAASPTATTRVCRCVIGCMVCDECRTSADGECGNEHRQSGRRERRRRRVQDEESRRGCGERAGEGDERDDRDRGELLRRVAAASAQSRGRWLVARSSWLTKQKPRPLGGRNATLNRLSNYCALSVSAPAPSNSNPFHVYPRSFSVRLAIRAVLRSLLISHLWSCIFVSFRALYVLWCCRTRCDRHRHENA